MKKLKAKQIFILVVLLFIQTGFWFTTKSIFGFIHTDGPYYGKVVDAATGEPVKEAAVAAVWDIEHLVGIKSITSFGDAVETVTDESGEYILPRIWRFSLWPFSWLNKPELLVFKAGYDCHPPFMFHAWTPADEKRKNMTKSEYQSKYIVQCKSGKACFVQLNKAESFEERKKVALRGMSPMQIPLQHKDKLSHIITIYNDERNKFGGGNLMRGK